MDVLGKSFHFALYLKRFILKCWENFVDKVAHHVLLYLFDSFPEHGYFSFFISCLMYFCPLYSSSSGSLIIFQKAKMSRIYLSYFQVYNFLLISVIFNLLFLYFALFCCYFSNVSKVPYPFQLLFINNEDILGDKCSSGYSFCNDPQILL